MKTTIIKFDVHKIEVIPCYGGRKVVTTGTAIAEHSEGRMVTRETYPASFERDQVTGDIRNLNTQIPEQTTEFTLTPEAIQDYILDFLRND